MVIEFSFSPEAVVDEPMETSELAANEPHIELSHVEIELNPGIGSPQIDRNLPAKLMTPNI